MTISDFKLIRPKFALPFAALAGVFPFVFHSQNLALIVAYALMVLSLLAIAVRVSKKEQKSAASKADIWRRDTSVNVRH
jgi:hypothetical protein